MLVEIPKPDILTTLLEYINPFQFECQHKNIWKELSCPLPFYIAIFHIKT